MKNIEFSMNSWELSPVMKEEFRTLQTNIEFTGSENQVICITSTYPNEGKSYVSFQLAKTIAEGTSNVLLIDADLRNSSFYKHLGYEKEMVGLSHILSKKAGINDAIYMTNIKNLFLLPTGVFSSNPAILLRSERFKNLLMNLKKSFDVIIIDTPPIGLVTDGTIVANTADASLLVLGAGMVSRKAARESVEALRVANENFLGVIINKDSSSSGGYGRYGRYGKYGDYGHVYGAGEEKKHGKK